MTSSVSQRSSFHGWLMVATFIGTVMFYSYPYSRQTANGADPRVIWHRQHLHLVAMLQRGALLALIGLSIWFVVRHGAGV